VRPTFLETAGRGFVPGTVWPSRRREIADFEDWAGPWVRSGRVCGFSTVGTVGDVRLVPAETAGLISGGGRMQWPGRRRLRILPVGKSVASFRDDIRAVWHGSGGQRATGGMRRLRCIDIVNFTRFYPRILDEIGTRSQLVGPAIHAHFRREFDAKSKMSTMADPTNLIAGLRRKSCVRAVYSRIDHAPDTSPTRKRGNFRPGFSRLRVGLVSSRS